jgi:hypothetical protein
MIALYRSIWLASLDQLAKLEARFFRTWASASLCADFDRERGPLVSFPLAGALRRPAAAFKRAVAFLFRWPKVLTSPVRTSPERR